ncbi:MAG: hemerythrin domain-containing protein, partial [Rhodobacteraceae bacterium]|nr:hemerythrin domain-containing protein [Paracoccaceae bacterium]
AYPRDLWESHREFDGLTRFWLERHLMFRTLLARSTEAAERHLDAPDDPRGFAAVTARLMGRFLDHLHGHHRIEDHHYFPTLSRLDPRLGPGFDLLEADHHDLDGHLHALAETTNTALRALAGGTAAQDETAAYLAGLRRLGRFLDRHLTDEEDLVVPVILHHAPDL